jgi:hypothetical protein
MQAREPETQTTSVPAPLWAERVVRLLDDQFALPGTKVRFGVDSLLGLLVPGAGDVVTAAGAAGVFWLAIQRGVPRVVLARMALNVAVDAVFGAVPLIGDLFDLVFRSNRRNLQLVERYTATPQRKARASDYLVLGLVALLLLSAVALPFVVLGLVIGKLWNG